MGGRPKGTSQAERDAALVKRGIAEHLLDMAATRLALELGCGVERARALLIRSVRILDE